MNEATLIGRLAGRFAPPEWAFLRQVRNATGAGRVTRTADAIAMSLWPSRGLELHGFEVKVSRSDWLREVADPAKADEIARFCSRWWIVTADPKMVAAGELPPTWGLMVPHGAGLRAVVEAPLNPTVQEPTRAFLASVLRSVVEQAPGKAEIDAEADRRAEDVRAECAKSYEAAVKVAVAKTERELVALQERLRAFESAAGVSIDKWSAGNIGDVVRALRWHTPEMWSERAKDAAQTAKHFRELADQADGFVEAWRAAAAHEAAGEAVRT